MEKYNLYKFGLQELDKSELSSFNGGLTEVTGALLKFLGMMFISPGKMALEGAAAHEIMGK